VTSALARFYGGAVILWLIAAANVRTETQLFLTSGEGLHKGGHI